MKIAMVYDAVYPWIKGGGEKHVYELAIELHRRGHEVHLFSMQYWGGPADMLRDGLHYHGLCRGAALYTRSGRRGWLPPLRFAWGVLWKLPRYRLREFDVIDVLAFPFLSVPVFVAIRWLWARRVPWILTWLEVWGPKYWRGYLGRGGWLGAKIERWCAHLGRRHRCISPTTARRLHDLLGVARDDIEVIPCGFSLPEGVTSNVPKDPHKLVAAGRLVHNKRIDVLLHAWPQVVTQFPLARLDILGDGPERAACEHLAAELGILSSVRFHGQIGRWQDVLQQIASASLLLHPSEREGQGLVVIESMALGTPVLVATGPETAAGDFLGDGPERNLALLPVDASAEQWAMRIVELLSNPPILARLAEHGWRHSAALDWRESIGPAMEQYYRSVVGNVPFQYQEKPTACELTHLPGHNVHQ
jgi:glycosyltransferase involved in cell wall biosynthesis